MSTLATTHGGLARTVRSSKPARHSVFGLLVDRMAASVRHYRDDRMFERLMEDDPRVLADFQAARARSDWRH